MAISSFRSLLTLAASALVLSACGDTAKVPDPAPAPVISAEPVKLETPPAGQLPDGVTPTAYRLDLLTDPAEDSFSGTAEIDIALTAPHARIWLHALGPKVDRVVARLADGTEIAGTFESGLADGGVSKIDFETPVPAGTATLVMDYTAPYNFGLAGLYKASQADKPYLATQMEPIDARRAFPSFDEPRFKTPWTVTVVAPAGNQVIANGALNEAVTLDNGMVEHRFATTRPIQSYLVALAVGPYDMRDGEAIAPNALRDKPIPFRAFAPAGKGDQLKTAMDATAQMLTWQEAYFDYPYPYGKLDLIAVPDFAYGAMENAGAIIYRESALLIDDRTSLNRKRGVLTTHAHELGHQWFGNLVTPAWWDDIWLNEAFATWISFKTMHDFDPEGGWDRSAIRAGLGAMGSDSLAAARQIRNPITRNGDILDGFDGITYRKGGSVLNMFESYLGEEKFREGIRLHMKRNIDGVADVNAFMQNLADGSGQPAVVESFKSFIFQPGIPMLKVEVSCPAPDTGKLTITQSRYAPLGSAIDAGAATWTVPFAARVSGPAGERTVRQMLTDKTTEIALAGDCPDWVMPNAGGAGYWRFATNDSNWTALAENYSALSAGEQLVYADSLTSGFRAGQVSADSLLTALAPTVDQGSWDAVTEPLGDLQSLMGLMDDEGQAAMRRWVQATYGDYYTGYLADKGAASLSQGDVLLRDALYSFLVESGDMPEARAQLLTDAKAYVGLGGAADKDAVDPSQLGTAMRVGTQEGGRAFFDAALKTAFASENQSERATIFAALAGNSGQSEVADLIKLSQGNGFSGQETWSVLMSAMQNEKQIDTVWPLFKASFDNVIPRTPEIRKPQTARAAGAFCSAEKAAEAAAYFERKAAAIPGFERSLAQGVEAANLCGALKAAKAAELKAALLK